MDTEKMLMGISQVEEDLMKLRFEINNQSYNGHEKLHQPYNL